MEWIDINERQPEEGQMVIVWGRHYLEHVGYDDNHSISFVKYTGAESNLVNEGETDQRSVEITHWQEINTNNP